jgi:hypothetical protein
VGPSCHQELSPTTLNANGKKLINTRAVAERKSSSAPFKYNHYCKKVMAGGKHWKEKSAGLIASQYIYFANTKK